MSSKLATTLVHLKQAQLKQLCLLCGLKTSGTKPELAAVLSHAAITSRNNNPATAGAPRRILSIDMGIRNLGYALLTEPPTSTPAPSPLTTADDPLAALRRPLPTHLHAWKRQALVSDEQPGTLYSDAFTPTAMAAMTDRLLRTELLALRPTHVLIERQRFRSGGGAGVFEWTLRVNTLEAMLHASLRTLRELGHWDGDAVSIAPGRVGPFWLSDGGVVGAATAGKETETAKAAAEAEVEVEKEKGKGKGKGGKKSKVVEALEELAKETTKVKVNSKKLKIDTVGRWLDQGDLVLPQSDGANIAVKSFYHNWKRFYQTWRRISRSKWKVAEDGTELFEDSRKLDDLADSLLQGMAWMRWEENKRLLFIEGGIRRLLAERGVDTPVDNTLYTSQPVI
ncbi:Ydc2-catalyt-domain-containing protein [Whalleya microplaca]|nr:Ydc2-catalyt-domain-containing protein [Whalleya microplaca]